MFLKFFYITLNVFARNTSSSMVFGSFCQVTHFCTDVIKFDKCACICVSDIPAFNFF